MKTTDTTANTICSESKWSDPELSESENITGETSCFIICQCVTEKIGEKTKSGQCAKVALFSEMELLESDSDIES